MSPKGMQIQEFLEEVRPEIRQKLEEDLREVQGLKFPLNLKVSLRKANPMVERS